MSPDDAVRHPPGAPPAPAVQLGLPKAPSSTSKSVTSVSPSPFVSPSVFTPKAVGKDADHVACQSNDARTDKHVKEINMCVCPCLCVCVCVFLSRSLSLSLSVHRLME